MRQTVSVAKFPQMVEPTKAEMVSSTQEASCLSHQNNGLGPVDAVFAFGRKQQNRRGFLKDDALAERPVTNRPKGQELTPVRKPAKSAQADVGIALRQAFEAAVNEDIPDELLDLLRRLD